MCSREQKLEEKEQAAAAHQNEAVALKAELQQAVEAIKAQADKQVADAAEDKQTLSRQQARLDTLQASCFQCMHFPVAGQ